MKNATIMGAREFETSNPDLLPDAAESLGPQHYPTPHRTSAYAMLEAIESAGLDLVEQQYVVDGLRTMKAHGYGEVVIPGAHLFALFRVRQGEQDDLLIGYRNSVAQSMARRACVGKYFPICTNVSLFGDDIVFSKKNTVGQTDIFKIAREGVQEKVVPLFRSIEEQLAALRAEIYPTSGSRRSEILRLFEDKVLPPKLIGPMRELYEEPERAPELFADYSNRLGLMQACTRLTNDLPLRRKAEASQRISRHFGFGAVA